MGAAGIRSAAGSAVAVRAGEMVSRLVAARLEEEPALRDLYEGYTDEEARVHESPPIEQQHIRDVLRLFHAWRVHAVRTRMAESLAAASFLDVGDTDGRILKDLGKPGLGLNLSADAVEHIRAAGIEAQLGDAHGLPFEDATFDCVLCFETLEHVENPHQLLMELGRVVKPDGRVFVSIPWVPQTFVHPRDPSLPRGAAHFFEFARDDFAAVVSHTQLGITWDTVCELFGAPRSAADRALLAAHAGKHIVGGTFRRFQFFELRR